jgi:hypothetical protein
MLAMAELLGLLSLFQSPVGAGKTGGAFELNMIFRFSKLFIYALMTYGFVSRGELFGNFLPDFFEVFTGAQRLDRG